MKLVLKIFAILVWYIGFLALSIKSYSLLTEAYSIDKNISNIVFFSLFGLLLAIIKIKYIFIKSCKNNLRRIDDLKYPKIWQFYRIRFFVFLAIVISVGASFSVLSSGHYYYLLLVGSIDMSLALSLLVSSFFCFSSNKKC